MYGTWNRHHLSPSSILFLLETIDQTRAHINTKLSLSSGTTDSKINRRYLVCYRGDVLAYSHSDRFCPLRIINCCYCYWLICRLCLFPWDTKPWVQLVRQRRTPLTLLTKKCAAGRDSPQALLWHPQSDTWLEFLAIPIVLNSPVYNSA